MTCQDFLGKAYSKLLNAGPVCRNVADLLDQVNRKAGVPIRFVNIGGGGITLGVAGIFLSPISPFLDNNDPSAWSIGILAHELWHETQGIERISTWGEIESYSLESVVYRELSGASDPGLQQFEQYRQADGTVTRDLCRLCDARERLLRYSGNLWLYANEPIMRFRPGEIIEYPSIRSDVYTAEDCNQCRYIS